MNETYTAVVRQSSYGYIVIHLTAVDGRDAERRVKAFLTRRFKMDTVWILDIDKSTEHLEGGLKWNKDIDGE
jgi:hypothetical protein